jgi:RNA polymerase sigma-70 factor (TIGR02960 family)
VAANPASAVDFEARVAPHRAALHAYCYRMLGGLQDAEDALQDTLLAAWRGLGGFEGRDSARSWRAWLYRIATNSCLHLIAQRPRRLLAADHSPATIGVEVDAIVAEPIWIEPYPSPADASYELRESVELAFVAALQHLPATQRAVLILRQVMDFDAAEVAALLDTTVPAVNSALQRARQAVDARVPPISQQATLRALGQPAERALVQAYVSAWGRGDVGALVGLLCRDARFAMPPIPTWFHGWEAIGRFLAERVFATAWRLVPIQASGQLAFVCYQGPAFGVGALNVVTLREGSILEMTGFLDPAVHARFGLPASAADAALDR